MEQKNAQSSDLFVALAAWSLVPVIMAIRTAAAWSAQRGVWERGAESRLMKRVFTAFILLFSQYWCHLPELSGGGGDVVGRAQWSRTAGGGVILWYSQASHSRCRWLNQIFVEWEVEGQTGDKWRFREKKASCLFWLRIKTTGALKLI